MAYDKTYDLILIIRMSTHILTKKKWVAENIQAYIFKYDIIERIDLTFDTPTTEYDRDTLYNFQCF